MNQHCQECGAELPNNALYCGRCGSKTTSNEEVASNINSAPIENVTMSPSANSMSLKDMQDSTSEHEDEEKQQTLDLPSEIHVEEEEQRSYLPSEHENEDQEPFPTSQEQREQFSSHPLSEHENEVQMHQEYYEPASSMLGDRDLKSEILANQFPDEQSQITQTSLSPQEMQSHYASAQKSESRPVSRCLLFSLVGLIVIVGIVVVLMSLFHLNLPGLGGSTNIQSSSSDNEIVNPTGSSLTASICANTSTPSSSVTNQGSTFTLSSSSGCSTVAASKTNSSCLIFPNPSGASSKYIVDVSNAAIDSQSYRLVLGVVDYSGPTTYHDASHISVGLSEGSTGRNFSWLYRSGRVTMSSDEQSGTMDVILQAVNGGNTLHIVGDWACGRLIRSK